MTARRLFVLLSLFTLILGLAATGRSEKPKADKPLPLPEVEVVHPVIREVVDYVDFEGEVEPYTKIRLKSQATGRLERIHVKEGAKVKKGDLLFEIDARSAMAERKKAEAALAVAQATLAQAEVELKRTRLLLARKATSQEDVDRVDATRKTALAQVHLAEANLDIARLNLEHTRIFAPISGRIGEHHLVVGSLVKADETELAFLFAVDRVHVRLYIPSAGVPHLQRPGNKEVEVNHDVQAVGETTKEGFPYKTMIDEIVDLDREIVPLVNDLSITRTRTTLSNGHGRLEPYMKLTFRLRVGKPYKAMLVPTEAYDWGRKYFSKDYLPPLIVLTNKDELEKREVSYGQGHGKLSIVTKGLATTDRVVVAISGYYLNNIHAPSWLMGTRVKPKLVSIPEAKKFTRPTVTSP